MAIQEAEMIRNARKPFELNAEEGDEVLIVSDTDMDPRVWSTLNKAARSMGINPTVLLMPRAKISYAEAPPNIHEAVLASDLCLFATSVGFVHNETGYAARQKGIKMIPMSEATAETLKGGAASADYDEIYELGKRIQRRWNEGAEVRITTPLGMDLEANIDGRTASLGAARTREAGHYVSAFPDGEVPIPPVEGTANGSIIWDTTMHEIGSINEPIEATVEDGFVTEIRGGREARKLREILESAGDPNVYNIAEISIGTNPDAEITGQMREDKKAWGYLHIAVGMNSDFGGNVDAPLHIDGVVGDSTLAIDDEVIVDGGEIVI